MEKRRIEDWVTLHGAKVEIRLQGTPVASGIVDAVTEDGSTLWLQSPTEGRKLFEKAEFYQAWAAEDGAGFHYRLTQHAI